MTVGILPCELHPSLVETCQHCSKPRAVRVAISVQYVRILPEPADSPAWQKGGTNARIEQSAGYYWLCEACARKTFVMQLQLLVEGKTPDQSQLNFQATASVNDTPDGEGSE